jgi:hypothetical protein
LQFWWMENGKLTKEEWCFYPLSCKSQSRVADTWRLEERRRYFDEECDGRDVPKVLHSVLCFLAAGQVEYIMKTNWPSGIEQAQRGGVDILLAIQAAIGVERFQ